MYYVVNLIIKKIMLRKLLIKITFYLHEYSGKSMLKLKEINIHIFSTLTLITVLLNP